MDHAYPRIVLTGGPCGGKTTALAYLYEKLSNAGYSVIMVPEVATMLINSGLNPAGVKSISEFENLIMATQVFLEDHIFAHALEIKNGGRPLMLCDRGIMDTKAYLGDEDFKAILARHRWDEMVLREGRYDGVFHLVTAADGKPEYYNLNNPARQEKTPEAAIQADHLTQEAWLGHPHLVVIDNSTLFEEKMKRLLNAIRKFLGDPVGIEIERKYLVGAMPPSASLASGGPFPIPVAHQEVEIEQRYLVSPNVNEVLRIRRRWQENRGATYYFTKKSATESMIARHETEKQITQDEYTKTLADSDKDFDTIQKKRFCFVWQNQYFEMDVIMAPERIAGLILLEIELTETTQQVSLPPWLPITAEVTEDPRFTNYALARNRL